MSWMQKNFKRACWLGLSFLALSCVSRPAAPPLPVDSASLAVAESASSIARVYEILAKIKSSENSDDYTTRQYDYDYSKLPPLWVQPVALDSRFDGDIELFLRHITLLGGLNQIKVFGFSASRPSIIHFSPGTRPLIDWLADAGQQSGASAVVSPSFEQNLIILRYQRDN